MSRSRRTEVERLFDGLVGFGRSVRSRSQEWTHHTGDLSRNDIAALGTVDARGACRPGAIADALNVGPSVVSRQLAVLHRLGLVERVADPDDGRADLVSLTDEGRARLAEARAEVCSRLAERIAAWDVARISNAADVLEELSALLSAPATHHANPEETHV